jgi:multidrug/hemolysin transport system ATP-binding protein
MEKIIEINNLHKYYGEIKAVKDISFYVETGKLFAFLGPNGAGKSTTIDIICTFLKPDSGTVIVDGNVLGENDDAIRRIIGAVFQDGLLDRLLTVEENIRSRATLYGVKGKALKDRTRRAAELAGVTELMKRPYGKLSGGQRRRCDIARALVNTPKVLFLDEPTTGLDPQTRKNVWDTIQKLQKESGMTVFLTTHYMEEAAGADYVIVIDGGEIAAKGTPSELREKYSSDKLSLISADIEKVTCILQEKQIQYSCKADRVVVNIANTIDALPTIEVVRPYITGFEVTAGTMDDAFIGITGKELREI